MNSLKTPKPLLAARMAFPLAASLITVLLGEWIARGALTADTVTSFIFPHAEAYLLAWLFLFLVWLLLDWIFRLPPLSTLGMAVLGCVPCAVNFYTLQLRGEPFLPWDLAQVSEAAGVASAAGIKIQTSMIVTVVVELALMAGSFFLYRGRHKQRWLPRVAGSHRSGPVPADFWRVFAAGRLPGHRHRAGRLDAGSLLPLLLCCHRLYDQPVQSGD